MTSLKSTLLSAEQSLEKFKHIPFGQSHFQNLCFQILIQGTPGRMARQVGLELSTRYQTVLQQERIRTSFSIKVSKAFQKFKFFTLSKEEKYFLNVAKSLEESLKKKLEDDLLQEILFLQKLQKYFPEYSREDFEKEEAAFFKEKLSLSETSLGLRVLRYLDDYPQDVAEFLTSPSKILSRF